MRWRRIHTFVLAVVVIAATEQRAQAEAILTVSGGPVQADAQGALTLIVNVDLADVAPNLVGFEFDVTTAGLDFVSYAIADVFEVDGDPLTQDELFDFSTIDPTGSTQIISSILNAPYQGATQGRLFAINFQLANPLVTPLVLSLIGHPQAEEINGVFRSESLVSEVAPFDIQPVPFVITLTSIAPGVVTMLVQSHETQPPGPDPSAVPEPASLLMLGAGLVVIARYGRRVRTSSKN